MQTPASVDPDLRLYYLLCSATAGPPVAYIEDLRDEIINVIIGGQDDLEDTPANTLASTDAPVPHPDATVEVV